MFFSSPIFLLPSEPSNGRSVTAGPERTASIWDSVSMMTYEKHLNLVLASSRFSPNRFGLASALIENCHQNLLRSWFRDRLALIKICVHDSIKVRDRLWWNGSLNLLWYIGSPDERRACIWFHSETSFVNLGDEMLQRLLRSPRLFIDSNMPLWNRLLSKNLTWRA